MHALYNKKLIDVIKRRNHKAKSVDFLENQGSYHKENGKFLDLSVGIETKMIRCLMLFRL